MERQAKNFVNAGIRKRKYAVGDKVLRLYPPNANDKLHPQPYMGPYVIKAVDNEQNTVTLDIPTSGRGKTTAARSVNMTMIKPYLTAGSGGKGL